MRAQGLFRQCREEARVEAGSWEGHLRGSTVHGIRREKKEDADCLLPLGWSSSAPYFPQPSVWIHLPVQMDRRAPIPSQGLYLGG